jgi:hypothetical protein
MTDRELWVKTCKTVGAMVGATVVFLGSMSLVLLVGVGRPAAPTTEAEVSPSIPASPGGAKGGDPALPSSPKGVRRANGSITSARSGESI